MHDVPTEIPDERILEVRDPDEINVEYARARLEEAGIVNGEVVDPEKLANAPIVRAVEAIAAELEQEADESAALTDAEYAQQYLTPDETVFEIDGRTYMVDRVNLEAGTVNIQDITFSNAPTSPMQEDIENKSLTLIINTSKLTARTLATAFMKFLRYSKNKVREHQNVKPQGKQSIKQLIAQNQGVENTELADRNEAKAFDRYARQYGVDYAIQKGFSQEAERLLKC